MPGQYEDWEEEREKKNVFELVFACGKYCFWVDILSEVLHGDEN